MEDLSGFIHQVVTVREDTNNNEIGLIPAGTKFVVLGAWKSQSFLRLGVVPYEGGRCVTLGVEVVDFVKGAGTAWEESAPPQTKARFGLSPDG